MIKIEAVGHCFDVVYLQGFRITYKTQNGTNVCEEYFRTKQEAIDRVSEILGGKRD